MYHQSSGRSPTGLSHMSFDMEEIVVQQLEVTLLSFGLFFYLEFNFEAIP